MNYLLYSIYIILYKYYIYIYTVCKFISFNSLLVIISIVIAVKRCSEMFLADLEKRWQESVRISNIADIICRHAATHFQVYVKYCSNQIYQDRTLKELKWVSLWCFVKC